MEGMSILPSDELPLALHWSCPRLDETFHYLGDLGKGFRLSQKCVSPMVPGLVFQLSGSVSCEDYHAGFGSTLVKKLNHLKSISVLTRTKPQIKNVHRVLSVLQVRFSLV